MAYKLSGFSLVSPGHFIVDFRFYEVVQKEAKEKLTDGTGHKPHYRLFFHFKHIYC